MGTMGVVKESSGLFGTTLARPRLGCAWLSYLLQAWPMGETKIKGTG